MNRAEEVCVMLDNYEQRVVVKGLADFRNTLIREEKPTEDVDDVLIKIINAPRRKDRRRCLREAR